MVAGRTVTAQLAETPPLDTVTVFVPVVAKFALKPEPVGLEIERSGEDHVYEPVPPLAVTETLCPRTAVCVAGEQVSTLVLVVVCAPLYEAMLKAAKMRMVAAAKPK